MLYNNDTIYIFVCCYVCCLQICCYVLYFAENVSYLIDYVMGSIVDFFNVLLQREKNVKVCAENVQFLFVVELIVARNCSSACEENDMCFVWL